MDLPIKCDALPFKLTLYYNGYSRFSEFKFSTDMESLDSLQSTVRVEENYPAHIELTSDRPYTTEDLYYIIEDSKTTPDQLPFEVYKYPSNQEDFLVPNLYLIKVYFKGVVYYTTFEMVPKLMDKDTYAVLLEDLRAKSYLLTINLNKRRRQGNSSDDEKKLELLDKFLYLDWVFVKIQYSLDRILSNPNSRPQKVYSLLPNKYKKIEDAKVTRWFESKDLSINDLDYIEKSLTPRIHFTEQTELNAWLKLIIRYLSSILKEAKTLLTELTKGDTFPALQESLDSCNRYIRTLNHYLNTNFLKDVRLPKSYSVPFAMVRIPYYSVLYTVYLTLKKGIKPDKWDINQFEKRPTHELYELWVYFELYEYLEYLGWELEDSSLLDSPIILLRNLEKGIGTVFMNKQNPSLQCVAYYNNDLKRPRHVLDSLTDQNPLYTRSQHTKPDIRLDLCENWVYRKSLILEVKYRDYRNIWNHNSKINYSIEKTDTDTNIDTEDSIVPRKVSVQIRDYASLILSKNSRNNPIEKVIVTLPKLKINGVLKDGHEDKVHNVHFISITPADQKSSKSDLILQELKSFLSSSSIPNS